MNRRFHLLLAACCLSITFASAQMNKIAFTEYDLDNGLHVILHQDNTTPIVAVSVMYHVGSKNEDPNRTGFAHFFEHLLFEGSENIKRGEFDNYIENAGGTNNANTSNDRTFYYEILPSNHLVTGLWLESERMLHAKVEDIGIETQREVVKEERRLRVENRPYGTVVEEVMKRAYKKHPYRWPVIGSMAHLDAATESDYKGFYEQFYVPNNAVLSIAGDINVEETKAMVQKYFGTIPRGEKEIYRPTIVEPALTGEIRDTVYDAVQLPGIIQAYRIPAQGTDDYYAVQMLSTLLSTGESSRLYKSLVDESQKAVFVGNFPFALEDPGVALVFGISNMGVEANDLEKAINDEINKTRTELITEKEFQKLRNQIESEFVTSNGRIVGIAESLADYHMYYGSADLINTEIDRYMKVTREDIQRVAKQYFADDNRITLFWLPKPVQP
ncbi:MAG: zinc protease [Flavobacteriales bacterium]|jgi:zinc protease